MLIALDTQRKDAHHGRVASGDCSPEAPTDPDVRISRIRLFTSPVAAPLSSGAAMRTGGSG